MIWNAGRADCTEIDRIELAQELAGVVRDDLPVTEVVVTAPGEFRELKAKASIQAGRRLERSYPNRNHLFADTVAGYDRHPARQHQEVECRIIDSITSGG